MLTFAPEYGNLAATGRRGARESGENPGLFLQL
jgi:hypothetical protein